MSLRRHALLIGIDDYSHLGDRFRLDGCRRDVELMSHVLQEHFDFPPPRTLIDTAATRQQILGALQDLLDAVALDDVVALLFSGHGSQVAVRQGKNIKYEESIVPFDSGRSLAGSATSRTNRDIFDKELKAWLAQLTTRAGHVTLIFDCCHSGSILRDPSMAKARRIIDENRTGVPSPFSWSLPGGTRACLRPDSGRYTLFAACRPHELAFELVPEQQGALTFYLASALTGIHDETTYRDIFEKIAPQVSARFLSQHPLWEGSLEHRPFAIERIPEMEFTRVLARRGKSIDLATGAIHGQRSGSVLRIHPAGSKTEDSPLLGRVRLRQIRSFTSVGDLLEDGAIETQSSSSSGAVAAGCRAVLESRDWGDMRLAVEFGPSWADETVATRVRGALERSDLLRFEPVDSEVCLHFLRPRTQVEPDDPLPHLGPVGEAFVAASGKDGQLILPLLQSNAPKLASRLYSSLETHARYRNLLQLENPQTDGSLGSQIELQVKKRLDHGTWIDVTTAPLHTAQCHAGDRIAITILNRSERFVFPYVLALGLTGRISLIHPLPGAYEPLPPGQPLEIGTTDDDQLHIQIPADLPFGYQLSAHSSLRSLPGCSLETLPRTGNETIKVFISCQKTDLSMFEQQSYRQSPLERTAPTPLGTPTSLGTLLRKAYTGDEAHRLVRCRPLVDRRAEDEWIALTCCFEVRF